MVVTGGAGFLGQFVVEQLRTRGVAEVVEGIVLAAERYNQSDPVNIGSSYEISIKNLTKTIARLTSFRGRIAWDTSKPNVQPRSKLDVSRAKEWFKFEAQTPFDEGLWRMVEWYIDQK